MLWLRDGGLTVYIVFLFFRYFLAHYHFCSSVDNYEFVELSDLDRLLDDVAIGIAADLGRGFLEENLQLLIGGIGLAVFQFDDVTVHHVLVDVAERRKENVGIATIVV